MDVRNSNGINFRSYFTLQLYKSFFQNLSPEVDKCIIGTQFRYFHNRLSKKSYYTFKDMRVPCKVI